MQQSYGGKKVDLFGVLNICFGEHIVHELEGQTVRKPRSRLGTSPWPLRHGGCSSPSATGAVGLPGGGNPILLVYRPAAVRLTVRKVVRATLQRMENLAVYGARNGRRTAFSTVRRAMLWVHPRPFGQFRGGVLVRSREAWEVGIITQFIIEGPQRTEKGTVLCTSKQS